MKNITLIIEHTKSLIYYVILKFTLIILAVYILASNKT